MQSGLKLPGRLLPEESRRGLVRPRSLVGTFRRERVEHVGDRDNARFQWNGHAERPLEYSQNALGGTIDGHALAVLKAKAFPQRHDTSRTAFAEPGADRTNSAMRAGQLPRSSCTAARS